MKKSKNRARLEASAYVKMVDGRPEAVTYVKFDGDENLHYIPFAELLGELLEACVGKFSIPETFDILRIVFNKMMISAKKDLARYGGDSFEC